MLAVGFVHFLSKRILIYKNTVEYFCKLFLDKKHE